MWILRLWSAPNIYCSFVIRALKELAYFFSVFFFNKMTSSPNWRQSITQRVAPMPAYFQYFYEPEYVNITSMIGTNIYCSFVIRALKELAYFFLFSFLTRWQALRIDDNQLHKGWLLCQHISNTFTSLPYPCSRIPCSSNYNISFSFHHFNICTVNMCYIAITRAE